MAESKDPAADSASTAETETVKASPETLETSVAPDTPSAVAEEPLAQPPAETAPRRMPLAAAVALALALGAIAGVGATIGLGREAAQSAAAAETDRANEIAAANRQLQDSLARLRAEVAALKTGVDSAQRSAGAQFGRLAEGLARVERQQLSLAASPTVTGSVSAVARQDAKPGPKAAVNAEPKAETKVEAKADTRPPVAEGWRLLDYYAGRAVVETPAGRLYDVGAGSNLPGLGRVQTIKRDAGQVVLTARNGVVAGNLEPRRAPPYRPYR